MNLSRYLSAAALLLLSSGIHASQSGPVFPTHRYPTDKSFHLGYHVGYFTSKSNFVSSTVFQSLTNKSKLTLFTHDFTAEFQPNRRLSVGGILNLTSGAMNPSNSKGTALSKLGDQRLFAEYRFYDAPGRSVGFAFVPKFPGYANPTEEQLTQQGVTTTVLLGDSQVDFTTLLTTEFWPSTTIRARLDAGYTYRTEGFSAEIPYMVSLGYANPRVDLDVRVKGNFSMGGGDTSSDSNLAVLKAAFENSNYAYSNTPWVAVIQPTAEFWVTPRIGLSFDFSYSLFGKDSARFVSYGAGISFREATTQNRPRKTFQEVDIGTDQEAGMFQGEVQGKPMPEESGDNTGGDEEF